MPLNFMSFFFCLGGIEKWHGVFSGQCLLMTFLTASKYYLFFAVDEILCL